MADFRKWFLAFALVALLLGTGVASAQNPTPPQAFTCVANAGTPLIVRVEGLTELVGDLLLQCQGGNPTLLGTPVPTTNLRLSLNTNITSRLIGNTDTAGRAGTNFIDALLLIDDPYPNGADNTVTHPGKNDANTAMFTPPNITPNSPIQKVCRAHTQPAGPTDCNYLLGNAPSAAGTAYGFAGSPYIQANQTAQGRSTTASTVYVGQSISASAVEWDGVPVDPPGTQGLRLVRLTNVRANACQLGLSSTLIPTQIVGFVGITGGQFFTINNPQQTLAYINQGLVVAGGNTALQQCINLNVGGGGIGGNINTPSNIIGVTSVNLKEGFAQSFKRQAFTPDTSISGTGGVGAVGFGSLANNGIFYNIALQNVPGLAYNTETAFQPTNTAGTTAQDARLGTAAFGTRFLLRFNNIGTSVRLALPGVVPLTIDNGSTAGQPLPPSAVGGWTGGYLVLIGTSDLQGNVGAFNSTFTAVGTFSGAATFFSSSPFKGPGAVTPFNSAFEVTVTAGTAAAVYETVNSDPSALEQGNIPIGVAFVSNTPQNLPPPGQSTVNASFAPLSTNGTASSSDFIPRFCDQSTPRNTFNINVCQCNLLFPFVTQAPGFDTGIAIANTTSDPYGTPAQDGPLTLWFYGTVQPGGGSLPLAQQKQTTTVNVPHGQVMTWTTFGGAGQFATGLVPTPGFTGYVIAVTNFQYCHGFAFISDLGAQKLAEGYLAIQLDTPQWSACGAVGAACTRTGQIGENDGH